MGTLRAGIEQAQFRVKNGEDADRIIALKPQILATAIVAESSAAYGEE